jgi:hypothetical protein
MTFVTGVSGNPAGRPLGARNRKTLIVEGLLEGDAETLTRRAIEMAHAGNLGAMRLCIDRLLPRGRERPVPLPLPIIESAADVRAAAAEIIAAVGAGTIGPNEALALVRVVDAVARLVGVAPANERPVRSEARQAENTSKEQAEAAGGVADADRPRPDRDADPRPAQAPQWQNTSEIQAPGPNSPPGRDSPHAPPADGVAPGKAAGPQPATDPITREIQGEPASLAADPSGSPGKMAGADDDIRRDPGWIPRPPGRRVPLGSLV